MDKKNKKNKRKTEPLWFIISLLLMGGLMVGFDVIAGIWYGNETYIGINETYNGSTIHTNHDWVFGWVDSDGDGNLDRPANIILDAPSKKSVGSSSYLILESKNNSQSNNLIFESKNENQSINLIFNSKYSTSYCAGTPSCIRNFCSVMSCQRPCMPVSFGCPKGQQKCQYLGSCDIFSDEESCNSVSGCYWVNSFVNNSVIHYTDEDTDAIHYTDEDTDAILYSDSGSYHINISDKQATLTDDIYWVVEGGFKTSNEVFYTDENYFSWYEPNNGYGIGADSSGYNFIYGDILDLYHSTLQVNSYQGISGTYTIVTDVDFNTNTITTCDFTFETGILVGTTC